MEDQIKSILTAEINRLHERSQIGSLGIAELKKLEQIARVKKLMDVGLEVDDFEAQDATEGDLIALISEPKKSGS